MAYLPIYFSKELRDYLRNQSLFRYSLLRFLFIFIWRVTVSNISGRFWVWELCFCMYRSGVQIINDISVQEGVTFIISNVNFNVTLPPSLLAVIFQHWIHTRPLSFYENSDTPKYRCVVLMDLVMFVENLIEMLQCWSQQIFTTLALVPFVPFVQNKGCTKICLQGVTWKWISWKKSFVCLVVDRWCVYTSTLLLQTRQMFLWKTYLIYSLRITRIRILFCTYDTVSILLLFSWIFVETCMVYFGFLERWM